MGEDLDPEVVHHPRGQTTGDLDLEPLAQGGEDDEEQVGDGRGHHNGEVEVALGHPVVDGVLGECRPDLGGHGDNHHQDPGQGQHARVLGQQPPQTEPLELALGAVLAEDDVRLRILRLDGQQLVHPVLQLVGDAGERQTGGGRGLRSPGTTEAPAATSAEHHGRPPPRTESSRSRSGWPSGSSGSLASSADSSAASAASASSSNSPAWASTSA